MMALLRKILKHGDHAMEDAVNEARLLDAERDLTNLLDRADLALTKIDKRHKRNHWQESIDSLIHHNGAN